MEFVYRTVIALLAADAAFAGVSPLREYVEHERFELGLSGVWEKGPRVKAHIVVPVRIGLSQSNLEKGHQLLMDISNPFSSSYGRHLSGGEVVEMFSPPQDTFDLVHSWVTGSGVNYSRIELSANKQWLYFDAEVSKLELFLRARYYEYRHRSGKAAIACDSYYVPEAISRVIDYIKPGAAPVLSTYHLSSMRYPRVQKRKVYQDFKKKLDAPMDHSVGYPKAGANCSDVLSPPCIRKLYNINDGVLDKQDQNSIGVYSNTGAYNQTSLNEYFTKFADRIVNGTTPKFKPVDGAPMPAVFPFVYPDRIENFQIDDRYYETHIKKGLYNTFLDAIDGSYCNATAFGITGNSPRIDPKYPDKHNGGFNGTLQCGIYKPPKVITISYGGSAELYPPKYQARQCNEFMKLGLQGVTSIVASGDSGIASFQASRKGNGICAPSHNGKFGIPYLSDCPYVTTVGATAVPKTSSFEDSQEVASTTFGSSGGFSNIYSRPAWQDETLKNYFRYHDPNFTFYKTEFQGRVPNATLGQYNRAGRGFPDVAAIGQRYAGFFAEYATSKNKDGAAYLSGTSLSAPIFASLIARINNYRLAAGKSSVGFINPVLYANPDVFNDIVKGVSNPSKRCKPDKQGYRTVKGWDPVTGLGTPNYERMLSLFMKLK